VSGIISWLAKLILPMLLDWIKDQAERYYDKLKKKQERNDKRELSNDKNIERLRECADLKCRIDAAADVFNGRVRLDAKIPEE